MTITYRPITKDEMIPFFQAEAFGFGYDLDESWLDHVTDYADLGRTTAALEDGAIVGTAGVYDFELTVPGACVPTAGVTWVSVRPTHRRRGVLTGMMRTQLDQVHDRGEALAALWASEAPIYGRFGYGLAAEGMEMRIARPYAVLPDPVPFTGRTRLVTRDEALASWPGIYDIVRQSSPGMISRSEAWWQFRHLREAERPRPGFSNSFRIQYEEDGHPLGYVRYRVQETHESGSANSLLSVGELIATTDAAYSALWSYIFGVDLVGTIQSDWSRIDEPLLHMLRDPRRLIRRTQDTLWVRLVDVPRALALRRYATGGRLVIQVEDRFCPWNSGCYGLEAGPDGASCTKTDGAPDIELDAATLGALYLGGPRFQAMARAGRVRGGGDALRRADAMFAWDPAPWIPEIF